jgi:hypothetical protein
MALPASATRDYLGRVNDLNRWTVALSVASFVNLIACGDDSVIGDATDTQGTTAETETGNPGTETGDSSGPI